MLFGVQSPVSEMWDFNRFLVPKFAGSHPAEAVGFLGRKNPQRAFLRRGSKSVGHLS